MTTIKIIGSSCGFESKIRVYCVDQFFMNVEVISDCEMASEWGKALRYLDWRKALGRISNSPVFEAAEKYLDHPSCLLPVALLKALEVELGASTASDMLLKFD